MADDANYASFMVRVWRDPVAAADGEEAVWAGEVEWVQSGRIESFRSLEALVALLVGQLNDAVDFLE